MSTWLGSIFISSLNHYTGFIPGVPNSSLSPSWLTQVCTQSSGSHFPKHTVLLTITTSLQMLNTPSSHGRRQLILDGPIRSCLLGLALPDHLSKGELIVSSSACLKHFFPLWSVLTDTVIICNPISRVDCELPVCRSCGEFITSLQLTVLSLSGC